MGKEPEATLKKPRVVDFQYAFVNRQSIVYQHGRQHRSGYCKLTTRIYKGLSLAYSVIRRTNKRGTENVYQEKRRQKYEQDNGKEGGEKRRYE